MNRHATLNRFYRLVWNDRLAAYVAVAETAKGRGKRSVCAGALAAVFMAAIGLGAPYALAAPPNPPAATQLPTGGKVVAGQAGMVQNANTLNINQSTNRAAIDWSTFNVGAQAQVNFNQPGSSSVTLNRVLDSNPSQIFGKITAPGQVYLTNPGGVYFAPSASADVGGLVATTHRISVDDFMAGKTSFDRNGATGSVINEGQLKAALGGYIALLAPEVRNSGVIVANLGTVALAAGEVFELQFDGNNTLANIRVTPSTIKALVENKSAVLAPGGLILLSAQALDRVQGGIVKNSGTLAANGMQQRGGRIVLSASDAIDNSGSISANASADGPSGRITLSAPTISSSGVIEARGLDPSSGGSIAISAGNFTQTASGAMDVSAPTQGGSLSIDASASVQLAGRLDASATADHASDGVSASQGGSIAVQAAQITLTDAQLKAAGGIGGRITLDASAAAPNAPTAPLPAPEPGKLALTGTTSINTRGRRGTGGSITLLGDDIGLNDTTALDASGTSGGGKVLVGGDWQGSGDLHQATTLTMQAGASIAASALEGGDGGKVVLWSKAKNADSVTRFDGSITANSASAGKGGQVETSGTTLLVGESARVSTLAANGEAGTWLLDPTNFTIASGSGALTTSSIGATTLGTSLNTSDVTIATSGTANGADLGDITLAAAPTWSSHTLTLTAHNDININANIAGTGTSALTLNPGASGKIWINATSIATGGAQTYNGSLYLVSADTTLNTSAGNGAITITGDVVSYKTASATETFTTVGTSTYTLLGTPVGNATLLVVGGGGSGGVMGSGYMGAGGGGGAGGVYYSTTVSLAASSYSVKVGGASTDSGFGSYTAGNGGTGGQMTSAGGSGGINFTAPGSAGGSNIRLFVANPYYWAAYGAGAQNTGTYTAGVVDLSYQQVGGTLGGMGGAGGGAGAGGQGYGGSTSNGGSGGTGLSYTINSVAYNVGYGGGGGGYNTTGGYSGGGGTGGRLDTQTAAGVNFVNGSAASGSYYGSGGGGGVSISNVNNGSAIGGAGKQGIVVLSYTYAGGIGANLSINSGSGQVSMGGATNLGTLAITSSNSANAITGVISGAASALSYTGTAAGVLSVSGNNTYGGTTTVASGTLKAGSSTGLGTGAATVSSGAVLDLNGQSIGNALTLSGTGISSGGALINSSGTAASDSGTLALAAASSIGGSGDITLSGVVSGTGLLTKVGTDTLTLSGANSNSGGVTVSAGKVVVTSTGTLGTGGTLTLNNASILDLQGSALTVGALAMNNTSSITNSSGTGSLTVSGTSTLASTQSTGVSTLGTQTYTGAVTLGAATALAATNSGVLFSSTINGAYGLTVNAGSASTTFNGIVGASTALASLSVPGNTTLGSGATGITTSGVQNFGGNLAMGAATTLTSPVAGNSISGVLSGAFRFTYAGTLNGVLTLAGTNTYSGGTSVTGGMLKLDTSATLSSTGDVTVGTAGSSTASFDLNGHSISNLLYLNGYGTGGSGGTVGALTNSGAAATASGTLALNTASFIGGSGDITLTGVISGTGLLTKVGADTLTLRGSNTYTGATTVSAGTLQLGSAGTLGSGT